MIDQIDPGYRDYDDPRLQPPEEPEGPTCGDCTYYREVFVKRAANGLVHCLGVCIFDVFQANTLKELAEAELSEVDAEDEPCEDFKEER